MPMFQWNCIIVLWKWLRVCFFHLSILSPPNSSRGAAIFSVQNLGRRRKNHLDFIFSVFAHFRQTDGVQVNIVVVPFDRHNPLDVPRFKQRIRVVVHMFKITCILPITYFTCNKYAIMLVRENSGIRVRP